MAKETKKQIKAQVINEVRRKYDEKLVEKDERIVNLNRIVDKLSNSCRDKEIENDKLREEMSLLKEKVRQYEDWIERMQEFCDMPDGERQQAFKTYMNGINEQAKKDEALKHTAEMFNSLTSILFG